MPGIGFPVIGTGLEQECVLDVVIVEWNTGTGTAAHTGFDERQENIIVRTAQTVSTHVILQREREREREESS